MNYVLVFITFAIIATVMIGIAILGTDRVFPGKGFIEWIGKDGIEVSSPKNSPLILSAYPDAQEVQHLEFSSQKNGYHRAEVDEVLTRLAQENERLQTQLKETVSGAGAGSSVAEDA